MSQEQIIKVLEKNGPMTATQIIGHLQVDDEPKEFIRRVLKKMRHYGEVKFCKIGVLQHNREVLSIKYSDDDDEEAVLKPIKQVLKKFPVLLEKIEQKKITRECYLYFVE